MKKLLSLLLELLIVVSAGAQTASVMELTIDHGVTSDGESGMLFHVRFSHTGFKSTGGGRIVIFFDCPEGVEHKDLNNRYCTTSGQVCVGKDFDPTYDDGYYKDFQIFMPYTEMHFKPGKNTYYCTAAVYSYYTGEYVTYGNVVSFTGTGSGNYNRNGGQQSNFPKGCYFYRCDTGFQVSVTCRYDDTGDAVALVKHRATAKYDRFIYDGCSDGIYRFNGFNRVRNARAQGYYFEPFPDFIFDKVRNNHVMYMSSDHSVLQIDDVVYKQICEQEYWAPGSTTGTNFGSCGIPGGSYNSGSGSGSGSRSSGSSVCSECGGTGRCRSCGGSGLKFNAYSGHDDTCPSCNGSGRCFMCRGNGRGF